MSIGIIFAVFILGTIVGSFLNVVSLRYGTGQSIGGRSFCPSCHKTLTWGELVPVFSFVIQGGKCRSCLERISYQYPLVEIITGVLFVLIHVHFSTLFLSQAYILGMLFYGIVVSLLIVIAVYDYHHKIIPDTFVYTLILFGGALLFVDIPSVIVHTPSLWHMLAGPLLFAPFALLWLISQGRWMGFGDAKLAWAMGWLLGMSRGITAVTLSFWIGAIYFLLLFVFTKVVRASGLFLETGKLTMKSEVPFGPFLVLGTYIALFMNVDLLAIVSFFFF